MAKLRLRIDFEPAGSLGPGKVALLEAIRRCGSISSAARELDMSYRRAWLLIDDLNQTFRQPVVSAVVGGKKGGGTELTNKELTERLLDATGRGWDAVVPVEDRKGHDRRYSVDIRKIREELG